MNSRGFCAVSKLNIHLRLALIFSRGLCTHAFQSDSVLSSSTFYKAVLFQDQITFPICACMDCNIDCLLLMGIESEFKLVFSGFKTI